MKIRRLIAVARKEFIHVFRDLRSLILGIAIPMMLLFLFGYALTLDVDRVPLAVWDQSKTESSRKFVSEFTGSRYFKLAGYSDSYRELIRKIDRGDALIALVIPSNFPRLLFSGRVVPVQVIVDGSDSNTASTALFYARAVTQNYSNRIVLGELQRRGLRAFLVPLELRERVWFNPEMKSRNFIVPGLIAVVMMIIAALLTSLTIAREWENGTMEQLISTPVKGVELIIGKLIPYFLIGMFDVLVAVLMGVYVFEVPLRGSILLLFTVAAIFLLGTLSLGILISTVTKNQLISSQLAMVTTFLPAFLLSGFVYPISNMPSFVQMITLAIPARYFMVVIKGIYLKGTGLDDLFLESVFLVIFAVLTVFIATVKFKKIVA